jgi:hypothetical protein
MSGEAGLIKLSRGGRAAWCRELQVSSCDETELLAFKNSLMSAKLLELPVSIRCHQVARELRESVIGVLKEIHRDGGDVALHRAARDLVASVAAIVAQRG